MNFSNSTNGTENGDNIFTKQDRNIACAILVCIGCIGITFHIAALILIRKISELHNVYGYLCVTNCVCAIVIMLGFTLYCAPATLSLYPEISEYWTHRIGQTQLGFYFVTLYTHVGTAINRYYAVCRPVQYRQAHSNIYSVIFISLVWLAGFLHVFPLFFGEQAFSFYSDSLTFYYAEDDLSQAMATYIDFIYSCSIMGIVFLLDCITLFNLNRLLKTHQKAAVVKGFEKKTVNKEVMFFIQAFLNMACFVVLLFFFHAVYRLVSSSKWGSFFTTTFAWEMMHTVDGLVLTTFSYMYSKKKQINCMESKAVSTITTIRGRAFSAKSINSPILTGH